MKIYVLLVSFYLIAIPYEASAQTSDDENSFDWEAFPIITYDTDAGFGYGFKGYVRSLFKKQESYDLILYNSTRGERWYRFQFSYPDYEIRQETNYGYAVDIIADYDKWINYYFYGIGNNSQYEKRKIYTKEPLELNLIFSRSLSKNFILQSGFKYQNILFTDFPYQSLPLNYSYKNKARQLSFLIDAVYDTRNSIVNPDDGLAVTLGFESSPSFHFTDYSFSKALLIFQSYYKITTGFVLAGRISLQQLIGNNIPVQFLLAMGGNQTLRGFPQDRFIDKSSTLINAELRFHIWKRFGGIAGVDAGRVFPSIRNFSFNGWKISPVMGLRFYMDNFVVRADLGLSDETIGFYFNFGHIF